MDRQLFAAAEDRDGKQCDALLKKGVNVNAKDEIGRTSLMLSVLWNRRECFERILEEKKVDVNLANEKGRTALHYAVIRGRDKMCDALLKKGANVNAKDENGRTPIIAAVLYNREECVKILSEKAADLRGALEIAKENGFLEAIKILKWSHLW
jgi:ankyrin repeat protein